MMIRSLFPCYGCGRMLRAVNGHLIHQQRLCLASSTSTHSNTPPGVHVDRTGGGRDDSLMHAAVVIPSRVRPTPFDTHKVFKQFEEAGFSTQQAEGIVSVLVDVFRANDEQNIEYQVAYRDLDLLELKLKGEVDSVRSEQIMLEKATIAQLRNEQEMLRGQISKLKDILKEELVKVQAGLQLDINLQKSRNKEMDTVLQQSVRDTNSRIGTEVALLRTLIESQKLELVKYLAGGIISLVTVALSVVLGLWRLLK